MASISTARRLSRAVNIEDLRDLARGRIPRIVFNYIDGGADDEWTLRENRRAFDTITFRPHQAVAVSACASPNPPAGYGVVDAGTPGTSGLSARNAPRRRNRRSSGGWPCRRWLHFVHSFRPPTRKCEGRLCRASLVSAVSHGRSCRRRECNAARYGGGIYGPGDYDRFRRSSDTGSASCATEWSSFCAVISGRRSRSHRRF